MERTGTRRPRFREEPYKFGERHPIEDVEQFIWRIVSAVKQVWVPDIGDNQKQTFMEMCFEKFKSQQLSYEACDQLARVDPLWGRAVKIEDLSFTKEISLCQLAREIVEDFFWAVMEDAWMLYDKEYGDERANGGSPWPKTKVLTKEQWGKYRGK